MKFVMILSVLFSFVACNSNSVPQPEVVKASEADCDKKAKETVEIKEEGISLTGNTGCSLDEVKP